VKSHLTDIELEQLLDSGAGSNGAFVAAMTERDHARVHLRGCEACQAKLRQQEHAMKRIFSVRAPINSNPDSECPADQVWMEIAAGISSDDTARCLSHAAECDHCGPLLRECVHDLSEGATPMEETQIAALASAHARWQHGLAMTLRASQPRRESSVPWWHRTPWLVSLAAGTGAVICIGAWLGLRPSSATKADELLAQAYTERRTIEVRFPGAQYSPIRQEQGNAQSSAKQPVPLLEAEILINENLRDHPNDPVWLDADARADMLGGNYDSAIQYLEEATVRDPGSADLLRDLGSAYYLRSQDGKHEFDRTQAVEYLERALLRSPDDPVALYNMGLACESIQAWDKALAEWNQYLRVDSRSSWAQDARRRRDGAAKELARKERQGGRSLLETHQLDGPHVANADVAAEMGKHPERYLQVAENSWLPLFFGVRKSPEISRKDAESALTVLSRVLTIDHNDDWLAEVVHLPITPGHAAGLRELLASEDAEHKGRYGDAIARANSSAAAFRSVQDNAEWLRSELEALRGDAITLSYGRCLQTAARMVPPLKHSRYQWLYASTLIEQAECLAGLADLDEAIEVNLHGRNVARAAGYQDLELRASAFGADYLLSSGRREEGLSQLHIALVGYWQSNADDAVGRNLYSALHAAAGDLETPLVDAVAIEELLDRYPSSDPVDQVVTRELLAGALRQGGDFAGAQRNLAEAAAELAVLPTDAATTSRRAEIAVSMAQVDMDAGRASSARERLLPYLDQLSAGSRGRSQAEYFQTLGEAYILLGQDQAAEPYIIRALSVRTHGLASLSGEADRHDWSHAKDALYHDLFEIDLARDGPAAALTEWEMYKGASLGGRTEHIQNAELPGSANVQALLRDEASPRTALISYIELRRSLAAYVVVDGKPRLHVLPLPPDLDHQARRFLSLCSDPQSSLTALHDEGQMLFRELVAPLLPDLTRATRIRFETDDITDRIPLGLLISDDGAFLEDKYDVVFSPGVLYGGHCERCSSTVSLSSNSRALIVASSASQGTSLLPLSETAEEGTQIAGYFRHPTLLSGPDISREQVLAGLRDAEVFHFTGHALEFSDGFGLLLGPGRLFDASDLASIRPRAMRMAVLSACDTAVGSAGTPADTTSLPRTLIASGVPAVVASRWQVDAGATRDLMRSFYTSLMSGRSPAASLRAARAAVRSAKDSSHPYYWGAFDLFGTT